MGPSAFDLVIMVLPLVVILGVWYFFMRNSGGGYLGLMKRQVEALERIATALEKRG